MKHSIKYFKIIFLCISALTLFGCATVNETLYLREAEVTGPITPVPIHLTDSTDIPSFTISPTFSYNTTKTFTGEVEEYTSLFWLDTSFVPSEHSLTWNVATVNAGLNFDFVILRGFALSFGANYSSQENFSAWSGHFGLGLFSYNKGLCLRLDGGLQFHTMQYDAYTVSRVVIEYWWGDREEHISFYHDIGESTHFDPYMTLTFNTAFKSWPVNIFINGGYVVQTLFSFTPKTSYYYFPMYSQTDARGSSTAGFISLTPGIYFNFSEVSRVLVGCRFYIETLIDSGEPKSFVMPMMQVDFSL